MHITSIAIDNFRAFHNPETISIPNGNNLLVYGENGSGKSSFFKAFHDFFNSSRSVIPFVKNSFRPNDEGFVAIGFTEAMQGAEPTNYIFHSLQGNTTTRNAPFIKQAYKSGGFLTYAQLLRTYLLESIGENPNLFELLINFILADHIIPYDNRTPLKKEWDRISRLLTMNRKYSDYRVAFRRNELSLDPFNDSLAQILTLLQIELIRLLNTYFNHEISIVISGLRVSEVQYKKLGNKDIRFNISYVNHQINDGYQYYLNEARLSALALCTYLASLKINDPNIPYKILFLDDVFIGLDTSNRIPLINVINNEFRDHQVFITTYDKNWFDLAKEHLNAANWSMMEMYYDRITQINPDGSKTVLRDEPTIINPAKDYITRANEYFKAKDYAATANYLRKEIERLVKSKLPLEYRTTQTENWGTNDITKLDTLIQNLVRYYEDCGESLTQNVKDAFSILRKTVLNPMSHDGNKSPTFRLELDKTFQLIDDFASIPLIKRNEILKVGSALTYSNAVHQYSLEIELADNLFLLDVNGIKKTSICKFRIRTWTYFGIVNSNMNLGNNQPMEQAQFIQTCDKERGLQEIYNGIARSLNLPLTRDLYSEFNVGVAGTLRDIINNS
jgi:energy-coupling factor transporter ATP-binding protein EcfA2